MLASSCIYGPGCILPCHCANNATCNSITGKCPAACDSGLIDDPSFDWTGPSCQLGNYTLYNCVYIYILCLDIIKQNLYLNIIMFISSLFTCRFGMHYYQLGLQITITISKSYQ